MTIAHERARQSTLAHTVALDRAHETAHDLAYAIVD
jgi:hypothetical protein